MEYLAIWAYIIDGLTRTTFIRPLDFQSIQKKCPAIFDLLTFYAHERDISGLVLGQNLNKSFFRSVPRHVTHRLIIQLVIRSLISISNQNQSKVSCSRPKIPPGSKAFERVRQHFEHHKTETSSNVHDANECDIILKKMNSTQQWLVAGTVTQN
jgi:hypothetical protein